MGIQLREDVGGFSNGAAASQVGDDVLIVGDPTDHGGDRPVPVQVFLNQNAEIDGASPGGDQVKSLLDQIRGLPGPRRFRWAITVSIFRYTRVLVPLAVAYWQTM